MRLTNKFGNIQIYPKKFALILSLSLFFAIFLACIFIILGIIPRSNTVKNDSIIIPISWIGCFVFPYIIFLVIWKNMIKRIPILTLNDEGIKDTRYPSKFVIRYEKIEQARAWSSSLGGGIILSVPVETKEFLGKSAHEIYGRGQMFGWFILRAFPVLERNEIYIGVKSLDVNREFLIAEIERRAHAAAKSRQVTSEPDGP